MQLVQREESEGLTAHLEKEMFIVRIETATRKRTWWFLGLTHC